MHPLSGVKVLDMGRAIAGGLTGQLLGDFGATVVKLEPLSGDGYRNRLYPTTDPRAVDNPRWFCLNRNKRSVAVNVKDERGIAILQKLIAWADVLIENLRVGAPERSGFGYEQARAINPRIVYASLSGYGETGPWSKRAGNDNWAQALAGNAAYQGNPGGEPYLGGTLFVDHGEPLAACYGIMAALYQREKTGEGALVATNLLDVALHMQCSSSLTDYLNGEELVVKSGRGWAAGFPYGAFPAADGELITMMTTDLQWDTLLQVLGLEELRGDSRYDFQEKRVAARFELYPILDAKFRTKTRDEWSRLAAATRVIRLDPAMRFDEVAVHPQVQANESIIDVPFPKLGTVKAIANPVSVNGVRSVIQHPPPQVGEHTREILTSLLGLTDSEIESLMQAGVVSDHKVEAVAEEE